MKRNHFLIMLWMSICLTFSVTSIAQSYTLTLEATSDGATAKSFFSQGESLYLNIVVDNGAGIAGCAFTLTYPANTLIAPQISAEGLPVNPGEISSFFDFTF